MPMAVDLDLSAAAAAVETAKSVVDAGIAHVAARGVESEQVVAYDLAHAAAAVETARAVLDYGGRGEVEARIACAFVADATYDVASRLLAREEDWGTAAGALDDALAFVRSYRSP